MSERSPKERRADAEQRARRRQTSREQIDSAYARDYRRATRHRFRLWHLVVIAVFVGLAGLGFLLTRNSSSAPRHANASTASGARQTKDAVELHPPTTAVVPTTQQPSRTQTPRPRPKATDGFVSHIGRISATQASSMTGVSWHAGCPVSLSDLRSVFVAYRDFAGKRHVGQLIVNRSADRSRGASL